MLCFLVSYPLTGQDQASVIPRINGIVNLDGFSDEQAWQSIATVPFVVQRPVFGGVPSERTEMIMAYDDNFLYIAGRLFDSEPNKIQAASYKRDSDKANSEWFGVALDTYNDNENAVAFFTTPVGLRWDATIVEGTGGIVVNPNWNTFWNVAVARDARGWFAEFRIPLSSLRFQARDGKVSMGLISWRLVARKNEWIIFPAISDEWGPASFYKISKAHDIVLNDIKPRKPVYFSPYLMANSSAASHLNMGGTAYDVDRDSRIEPGMDIKFGLAENITVDATINTDFSQVEVDDRIVNLDRFSYFLPEKRQFFQERSRSFDFSFDAPNQVFYSRRIGLMNGEPVRIWGGLRAVVRAGKTDIGMLDMQTDRHDSASSQNLGVFRLKRQIINPYSYVGNIVTTQFGTDGSYALSYGIDGLFRLNENQYLKFAMAQTANDQVSTRFFSSDPTRLYLNLERRSTLGFAYSWSASWIGRLYNPQLGFESRSNYHATDLKLSYRWRSSAQSFIYRTTLTHNPKFVWGNNDNALQSMDIPLAWTLETKPGYSLSLVPHLRKELIESPLTFLGTLQVPVGDYHFVEMEVNASTPSVKSFYLSAMFKVGSFYDGRKTSATLNSTWNVSSHLELEATYQLDDIRFDDRNQEETSHLFRLKTLYMLDTRFSLAVYLQHSNIERLAVSNIRFRYNPREGNDFYIVFNQGLNTVRDEEVPIPPVVNNWNLSLKYVYTFVRVK